MGDTLIDEPTDLSVRLATVFSQMTRVRTFRLMNSAERGPWPALLKAVFTTPSLTCLEIWESPWRRPEEKFTIEALELPQNYSSLQRFVYRVPFSDCFPRESKSYGRRDRVQGSVELSNLRVLASLICDSVEVLELPAELAFLLTHITYPKLRVFSVQGHEPLQLAEWAEILRSARQLREVHLQTPIGFTEWSKTSSNWIESNSIPTAPVPQTHSDDLIMRGLSNLESLTISNPLDPGKELFFQFLPYANLRTFSLKAFPPLSALGARWSGIHSQVLTSSEILCILKGIQLINLSTFEVSYSVDAEDGVMLSHISSSFPSLEKLEIHRYRSLAKYNSEYDPLVSMPDALATATNLQHLMLNLDFPERPYWRDDNLNPERYKVFHGFLESQVASPFTGAIPSLKTLGILCHDAFSSYWDTWEVSKTRKLVSRPPHAMSN
ncbi:hypothetical protein BT96DRAFT_141738 [Gymnopus androsaceus JB14]|uniref:F-box domain-containing protein n=1 Tax=Gymnopus androsaceus JB14 TaxID=1447944 RepID=A0A6A4HDC8_9AGAR|nr:hypothetical protein BT96DRAFT_141738 [Gymnopus androsaceus JB14]